MAGSKSQRAFDLFLVLAAAPLWLPVVLLLMALVALVDGRPVFFRQWRVGWRGSPFRIFKLRTMTLEAEPASRRPTRLGGWLRRRGLDELPQILNVVLGHLSLVGPRPLTFADLGRLVALFPPFLGRLETRPGITGPSQVSQIQGAAKTARLDLAYARSRSLWVDVVILVQTVWINIVGKQKGARAWSHRLSPDPAEGLDASRVLRETVAGILAPRRLIPILLVCLPMLYAQDHFSRASGALLLGILMCLAFVFVAPVSWRLLLPEGVAKPDSWVRLLLYALLGAGVVSTLGLVVPKLFGIGVTFLTARVSLFITLGLFLVGGWGLARDIDFEHRLARERARANRLAVEAERAQLMALRAQLDPHFLFNTLNAIAEWCRQDGVVAEQAVLQLSRMLRLVLEGVKAPAWPLEKELDLIDNLFALHRLRDPDLFAVETRVEGEVAAIPVPPLSLLPLAENAVKHGPAAGHRGRIDVAVRRQGDELVVELENPGRFAGPREGGEGLPHLRRRLFLAYGESARLSVVAVGERTRAEWIVPVSGPVSEDPT
jgi:two-component system sensor histidine kinase AlgZ